MTSPRALWIYHWTSWISKHHCWNQRHLWHTERDPTSVWSTVYDATTTTTTITMPKSNQGIRLTLENPVFKSVMLSYTIPELLILLLTFLFSVTCVVMQLQKLHFKSSRSQHFFCYNIKPWDSSDSMSKQLLKSVWQFCVWHNSFQKVIQVQEKCISCHLLQH